MNSQSLAEKTRALFHEELKHLSAKDERARSMNVARNRRHRLCVQIEASKNAGNENTISTDDLRYASELLMVLEFCELWIGSADWLRIRRGIISEYEHTMFVLALSWYLSIHEFKATIVLVDSNSAPDLRFVPDGGKLYAVFVEVFQPESLRDNSTVLNEAVARRIAHRAVKKGKRQLGPGRVGFVCIGAFHRTREEVSLLAKSLQFEMHKRDLPNLAGCLILNVRALFASSGEMKSAMPGVTIEFAENSSYFGPVEVEIGPIRASSFSLTRPLRKMDQPNARLALVRYVGVETRPLFIGTGHLDRTCASCGALIAKGTWPNSLSQVQVECPECGCICGWLNTKAPRLAKCVELTEGVFSISGPIILKRNVFITSVFATANR